jgi:hypothetical protein
MSALFIGFVVNFLFAKLKHILILTAFWWFKSASMMQLILRYLSATSKVLKNSLLWDPRHAMHWLIWGNFEKRKTNWTCCAHAMQRNKAHIISEVVRFLVVELTHPDLNPTFDMCVIFTVNYSFSGRWCPRRQRDALGDRLRESQDKAGSVFQMCS